MALPEVNVLTVIPTRWVKVSADSKIRESLFGAESRRSLDGACSTQDSIIRQFVGAGSLSRDLEVVQGLPDNIQPRAIERALPFLNHACYHPLEVELVGRFSGNDAQEPAVLIPIRVHAIDDIVPSETGSIFLNDGPITARKGEPESDNKGKFPHMSTRIGVSP